MNLDHFSQFLAWDIAEAKWNADKCWERGNLHDWKRYEYGPWFKEHITGQPPHLTSSWRDI